MASINYATREISCKIVYYGPGLSGKTTNLQIIHRKIPDKDKSEMVSLATETDRTLFFDFLPLDLGSIKGFSTKFQLYTVPGQVYYNATRKLVLRGVDGVVFVVDSQVDKLQENLESFANLQENLREYGHSIENIPLVLQYNKRDLPNVYSVEQLNELLNKLKLPHYEAVAATGVGVFTTLKGIGKSVIDKFNAKYAGFQGTRRPARPGEAAAPAAQSVRAPQTQPSAYPSAPPTRPSPSVPQPFPGNRAPLNVPSANPPLTPGGIGFSPNNPFASNRPGNPPAFSPPPSGFTPPVAGIPVSPFLQSFQTPKSGFPGTPSPGGPGLTPKPLDSFGAPSGPQGFGQPPPNFSSAGRPADQGFPPGMSGFGNPANPANRPPAQGMPPPAPQNFGQGNFGGQGNPGNPFGGNSGPMPSPMPIFPGQTGPAFPASPFGTPSQNPPAAPPAPPSQFSPPPLPPITPPPGAPPAPPSVGPAFPMGASTPGTVDRSGIVTTYEDMAKDDSFKTKKLPHPNEKKKGFFDGLFKKEK